MSDTLSTNIPSSVVSSIPSGADGSNTAGEGTRRFKRGDVREDGMVFWEYGRIGRPIWLQPGAFLIRKEKARQWQIQNAASARRATARYTARNREKILEKARKRYAENKEKEHEKARRARERDPEKYRERRRRYAAENPDKVRISAQKSRQKHQEKIREKARKRRAENKEWEHEKYRRAFERNPERHRERWRKYRRENPDKHRASLKRWAEKNPGARLMHVNLRRARKLNQTPPDANRQIIAAFYHARARVVKCTGLDFHVDHIFPLAKGGPHHQANLQLLPAKINISKGAKIPLDSLHTIATVCMPTEETILREACA